MRPWWLALGLVALAGCASPAAPPPSHDAAVAVAADPWEGQVRQTVLDIHGGGAMGFQLDVLCLSGGGVEMRRADGLVLNGTTFLEASVTAPITATGLQLGYVLVTGKPGYDETAQKGITWLDAVRDGSRTFRIPMPANGTESPDGDGVLWHFYSRMNVPVAPQDCYTGAMVGDYVLHVDAVKG